MRSGFRLSCLLVLVVLACATHRLPAQDAADPAPRMYYMELGLSLEGLYDIPRLTGEGSFPLQLFPGSSIVTSSSMYSHSFASPSVEFGMHLHGNLIWVFAGMEFHPAVRTSDYSLRSFGPNERAYLEDKSVRGNSVWIGTMFEQFIIGFFGLYGKASVGYYNFDQSVKVYEQSATASTTTIHQWSSSGLGGSIGAGIFFNLWGVRIRGGLRTYYVGGNGSVSSSDFRLAIAYVM